ncbi:uncharacterized protein EMH_0021060 [Eimeria mitis]|uniref:Protein kinase domain-containing protein n=1 Tax=Eimeria mitis TaxID=44415 RepID=U6KF55_9EIME|nr:uncharacterized protein EMH_0021060 [Eimeria mitis]CDJ36584.1 hypothetical protein EMH_0021060 [Eimeria mitis]
MLMSGNQGAPGRRRRDSLRRLGHVSILSLIVAFTTGLLLGTQLPSHRVQPAIPVGIPTIKDREEEQLPLETPSPPPSLPEEGEAALGATEVHEASLVGPQLPPYDEWGLPSLNYFEQTLSPVLKQGREEISSLLHTLSLSTDEPDDISKAVQRGAARVLSRGENDELVGMTITLRDVEPIKARTENQYVPRSFLVRRVLSVRTPSIVMEVEDITTGNLHTMRLRWVYGDSIREFEEEEMLVTFMKDRAKAEESIARQASLGTPAHLVATQKGFAVPLYVGNAENVPDAISEGRFYYFRRVQILERLHGEFSFASLITADLSVHAREYIAHRLLHIVLKLQQALLSHNDLDWENIDARPDGSFLLSNFDACIPFGKTVGYNVHLSGKTVEPMLRIRANTSPEDATPYANSDLWSLGMLLYELFTGGDLPYTNNPSRYTEEAVEMAQFLMDMEVQPEELVLKLDAVKCPVRWKQLILKLLHPSNGQRLATWDIFMEFPDLVGHRLPR